MGSTRRWELGEDALCGPRECLILPTIEKIKIEVGDHVRQAKDAVNRAVKEYSENYEILMMHEIQGGKVRCEGRKEDYARKERRR